MITVAQVATMMKMIRTPVSIKPIRLCSMTTRIKVLGMLRVIKMAEVTKMPEMI